MLIRTFLAAAALTLAAAPVASAQAARPVYATTAEAEAALQTRGAAVMARLDTMKTEMRTAAAEAGGDRARLAAALDAIVARHQPDVDAFAGEMEAFFANPPADMPAEQRAGMLQAGPTVVAQLKGLPALMRQEQLAASGAAGD